MVAWFRPRVGDEFDEVAHGQIVARHQERGLIRDQRHGREIGREIV